MRFLPPTYPSSVDLGSLTDDSLPQPIVSIPMIVLRIAQLLFDFIATTCLIYSSSGSPTGLSGFAIFVSVARIVLLSFMMAVPSACEKHDRLARLAQTLRGVRGGLILIFLNLLVACVPPPILSSTFSFSTPRSSFITTISTWIQPECKAAWKGQAGGRDVGFRNGLPGWCATKRAGVVFFWLAFFTWTASFVMNWRSCEVSSCEVSVPPAPPLYPPQYDPAPYADPYAPQYSPPYAPPYAPQYAPQYAPPFVQ